MRWQELPQNGEVPVARSSHALAAVGNKLYLFGGEQQPRVPLPATTYCYDIDKSTWVALSTTGCCPGPRIAASMVAVGHLLYLYGGRTGIDMGEGAKSDLYVFDTTSHEWQPVAVSGTSPHPPARSYHAMTADPATRKLYIFGGCGSSGRLADLWCFHIPTATWQQLPSSDTVAARGGSVLVAAAGGQQLYVLGGFNGAELQDCHVFDTTTHTWACPTCCDNQPAAAAAAEDAEVGSGSGSQHGGLSMLLGRSVFGAALHTSSSSSSGQAGACCGASAGCQHAGHVVTFGGEVSPSDKGHAGAGNFTDVLHCLAPSSSSSSSSNRQAWHRLAVSGGGPGPRGWFASSATPAGSLVVHGGLGPDNERCGDMFMLHMHE